MTLPCFLADASSLALVAEKTNAHSDYINSVAFSPDGTKIVSGSDDKTIKAWDAGANSAPNRLSLAKSYHSCLPTQPHSSSRARKPAPMPTESRLSPTTTMGLGSSPPAMGGRSKSGVSGRFQLPCTQLPLDTPLLPCRCFIPGFGRREAERPQPMRHLRPVLAERRFDCLWVL